MRRYGGVVLIVGLLASAGAFLPARAASSDIISTYAGGLGEGAATDVGQTPAAVAVHHDAEGDAEYVYVADTTFNVVRRITVATGHEEVFAGTGEVGFGGDGGPATEAKLAFRNPDSNAAGEPGLAVDAAGNLYIADEYNHRVRMVDADGVITTIVGTGEAGFNGDAQVPTATALNHPGGLVFDAADDLYIADTANHRVRKVVPAFGTKVTTYAGNGTGAFAGDGGVATEASIKSPRGLAFDPDGVLYIADTANCRVRAVDAARIITTFAGDSTCGFDGADGTTATNASLRFPRSVAVDVSAGDVYIADTDNCIVRRVDFDGRIYTAAGAVPVNCGDNDGAGVPTAQKLDNPLAVAMFGGDLLVSDTKNHKARLLADGTISPYAGMGRLHYSGDGGAADSAQVADPWGVAVGPDGSVFLSDWQYHVVRRIDANGIITTYAGTGEAGYSGDGGAATNAQLTRPQGLAVDGEGNLFIADTGNCIVRQVTPAGVISTVAGVPPDPDANCDPPGFLSGDFGAVATTPLWDPHDVDVDSRGHLFIANTGNNDVLEVDADRAFIRRVPGTGTGLNTPRGVAVDGTTLYVADTLNNRVVQVDDGASSVIADSADGLSLPYDVDARSGVVYVADTHADVIRKVDGGAVTTVAGTGVAGFSVDGGSSTSAQLDGPHGVAAGDGVVYIADTLNRRLRRVGPPPPVPPTAPTAPTSVAGEAGNGSVTVSWSPPLDDGGAPVDEYRVYQDGAGTPVAEVTDGSGSATITGLTNGTAYAFTVTATNEAGEGPAASTGAVTPRTVPGAPTGVAAAAGDGDAAVSWTAPADDGGAAISSYEVETSPGGKKTTVAGNALSATVTGLTNGTSYTFAVRAFNAAGAGAASAPSNAVTPEGATDSSGPGGEPEPAAARSGYWMLGEPGAVYSFGDAAFYGSTAVAAAAVDIESSPTGNGYWVLDAGGHVHPRGDAGHYGSLAGALPPGEEATSMSATPTGAGYWIFSTAGRVTAFGDARHFGDMAGTRLNGPVLDSVATPSGEGYYMVASDGGVFTFGDAVFHGSMGAHALNKPVQSLTADPDGVGYWLVASDGGVFSFEAGFYGSMGGTPLNQPVTRMVAFGSAGYLMVATDGGIFSFGSAPFYGSLGANPPPYPIRSVAILDL